jgi:SulP family sulfate permease
MGGERDRQTGGYRWGGFRADLVAGLTVAAVALPQAMAYALIAGIEPRYGLYTAIIMTALASLFGSSAHLINGPTNAISLVVLSAVAGLPGELTPQEKHQAVFLLAVLVGVLQVLIYFFKLGDLTRYVSESVVLGFMLGAGLLVALTQLPNLLGIREVGDGHHHLIWRLGLTLFRGDPINPYALALGLGTAACVVGLRALGRRLGVALPDMLLALVLAALVAPLLPLGSAAPLTVPAELPTPQVPSFDYRWVQPLTASALPLAILGLLEAIAIAKSIAARTRQKLDYNWQCLAEGLANIGGGFFQCMPGSGSLTRSAINYQAGAVSRASGVISACAVALVVLLFADLARFVPRPALAGILLITAWRLIDKTRMLYALRATSFDRWLLLATAGSAVFISVEFSILIGVFLSFFLFVPRVSRLMASELVLSRERVVRERQPDDPPCDKLVVLGLEGQLFFGAAPELDQILDCLTARAEAGARVIVLRLKRTHNPDMVCLERLHYFLEDMKRRRVIVLLCGVRAELAHLLERLGFHECLPPDQVFLEDAPAAGVGLSLSSTLRAVKRAYELLGDELCATCPRRREGEEKEWYYMI